jgi:hypothetical protein
MTSVAFVVRVVGGACQRSLGSARGKAPVSSEGR